GRVRLSAPVRGVDQSTEGSTVHLHDGASLEAAAVVLALPLPLLLQRLEFRLPEPVAEAAGRLGFGDAAKLHVPLSGLAEPGGVASPEGRWWCWVSASAEGTAGAPVLSCFAGGVATTEGLGLAADPERWAAEALALRPDVRAAGDPMLTHWAA